MLDFLEIAKRLYDVSSLQGYTDEEIGSLKQIFGEIPKVLEEYYRTAGKTKEFQYGQDRWVVPEDYKKYSWYREFDGMIIYNENQGVCDAYIRKEDLSLQDPPVYNNYDDKECNLCTPSLSEFLVAALTYNSVFMLEYSPEDFFCMEVEDFGELEARLEKYPFEIKNWLDSMKITFYRNDPYNLAVVMDCDGDIQLLYGASNEDSFNKIQEALEDICEPL